MPATTNTTFPCPRCRKSHDWRPDYVGRVAQCACGHVLKVPDLKLRDEDPSTEKFTPPPPKPAAIAVAPGFFPAAATAAPRSPSEVPLPDEPFDPDVEADLAAGQEFAEANPLAYDPWKDHQLPVGLIVLGLLPSVIELLIKPNPAGFVGGLVMMAIILVVNLILMLGGVLLASKFAGIHFGDVKPAILKLTAVYIGPSAVGQLITAALGGDMAVAMLGNAVSIVLYWALISYMFRLDGQQTMICVCTIGAVRLVTSMCLLTTLMAALGSMMGGGAESMGGGGGAELPNEFSLDE